MVRTMTEGIVNRFLSSAKAEMLQKNETEIRCLCRRCKLKSLMDPNSGKVRDHLPMRGFMDGYRWQGDEDDYEVVHGGRARNKEGQQDNSGEGGWSRTCLESGPIRLFSLHLRHRHLISVSFF